MTVIKSNDYYHIVIGKEVPLVYQSVLSEGQFKETQETDTKEPGGRFLKQFVDLISGIFLPVLGVLAASGMLKGFNALFIVSGLLSDTSGTYQLLNATGDALFYFFPIILGYTASKKAGLSPFIGMTIGAVLLYPALTGFAGGDGLYTVFEGTVFESPVALEFLGIPVIFPETGYGTTVIPVILAVFLGAQIEKGLHLVIPDVVKMIIVPFATLLTIVPLTFIVIGPLSSWAANLIGVGTIQVYELSPTIAGLVLGGVWQILVVFGLHWGLIPVILNNLFTLGYDPILSMVFVSTFAQTGAIIGVLLKTKEKKVKTLSIPAIISGLFGIIEPAIYGISLPLFKPFVVSIIGSALGGAILGLLRVNTYIMGSFGIFGFTIFLNPAEPGLGMMPWVIVISIAALVFCAVVTYLVGFGTLFEKDEPIADQTLETDTEAEEALTESAN